MRQECGWFDDKNHSTGALSTRLTGDARNVQAAIGYPISMIIQSISTVVIGIFVAFAFSVKLSVLCLTAIPLTLLTVILEAK